MRRSTGWTLLECVVLVLLLFLVSGGANALGTNLAAVNVGSPVGTWGTAQAIILNVTVVPGNGSSPPSGSVQFLANGLPVGVPVALNAASDNVGGATTTVSIATPGNYAITASYSGDANFAAANSQLAFPMQVVTNPVTLQVVPSTPSLTLVAGATKNNTVVVTYTPINGFHGGYQATTTFTVDPTVSMPGTPATLKRVASYNADGLYVETITVNSTSHLVSRNGSVPATGKRNLIAWGAFFYWLPARGGATLCVRYSL